MRVAWICPFLPWPPTSGGRLRVTRLAEGVAALATSGMHISLFAVRGPSDVAPVDDPPQEDPAARRPWSERHTFASARRRRRDLLLPYAVRARPAALAPSLAAAHARARFDVAVVSHGLSVSLRGLPREIPVVIDEHNVDSDYARRALAVGDLSLGRVRDAVAMPLFEKAAWRRASAVCVVGDEEARAVTPFCARTVVVPNGVDVDERRFIPPSARRGHKILFLGYFAYEPNAQAARFLALEVLPLVRREVSDATLTLVGRDAPADLRALRADGVDVRGPVADLGPILDEHAVFLNGVRTGAGTSLKVLDAFAAGLPVVSTRFGVRGLRRGDDDVALLADDAPALARAVVSALRDPSSLDDMARHARALAEERSWRTSQRLFADVVALAAGTGG